MKAMISIYRENQVLAWTKEIGPFISPDALLTLVEHWKSKLGADLDRWDNLGWKEKDYCISYAEITVFVYDNGEWGMVRLVPDWGGGWCPAPYEVKLLPQVAEFLYPQIYSDDPQIYSDDPTLFPQEDFCYSPCDDVDDAVIGLVNPAETLISHRR